MESRCLASGYALDARKILSSLPAPVSAEEFEKFTQMASSSVSNSQGNDIILNTRESYKDVAVPMDSKFKIEAIHRATSDGFNGKNQLSIDGTKVNYGN